jgi:hypothetical protein
VLECPNSSWQLLLFKRGTQRDLQQPLLCFCLPLFHQLLLH